METVARKHVLSSRLCNQEVTEALQAVALQMQQIYGAYVILSLTKNNLFCFFVCLFVCFYFNLILIFIHDGKCLTLKPNWVRLCHVAVLVRPAHDFKS